MAFFKAIDDVVVEVVVVVFVVHEDFFCFDFTSLDIEFEIFEEPD